MIKRIVFKIFTLMFNNFESNFLRDIYRKWYSVSVGKYSYGCFDPRRIPRGAKIGNFCSFSNTCRFFVRDHGIDFIALHPYLYNSALNLVDTDVIESTQFVVEDDVWIGHNVTITSRASVIGRGSVIAANSVVTSSVPRYAIVAGSPAKVVRYRFSEEVILEIEKTKWWCWDKSQLQDALASKAEMIYEPGKYFEKKT